MKRAALMLGLCFAMVACTSKINIDIEGRLADNAASKIYLVVEDGGVDTLASAAVGADNTFHLKGRLYEPTTAFLCDDNGNALTMFLAEDAPLKMRMSDMGGYVVEGGAINDKYNLTVRQLSDLATQFMNIDEQSPTAEEEYESLLAKYHLALSSAITYNLDNLVGVELFLHQESLSMTAEDMRVRFNQFSPKMRKLASMRQFERYIGNVERSQLGQPFIDAKVETITGQQMSFGELCGQGKWVLLNFWATWSEPCLRDVEVLREAYARYALMGFEICSIALDPDIDRLRAFVAKNQMLWSNVLNTSAETDIPLSELYAVHSIPAYCLISPSGEIVMRDLRGENLLHELQHIIEGEEFCTYPQLHQNQHIEEKSEK